MASAGNKVLYPNERLNGGAFVKRRRMRVVGHWDCLRDYLVRVDATGEYLAAHRPSAAAGLTKDSKRAAVFNHQIRYADFLRGIDVVHLTAVNAAMNFPFTIYRECLHCLGSGYCVGPCGGTGYLDLECEAEVVITRSGDGWHEPRSEEVEIQSVMHDGHDLRDSLTAEEEKDLTATAIDGEADWWEGEAAAEADRDYDAMIDDEVMSR